MTTKDRFFRLVLQVSDLCSVYQHECKSQHNLLMLFKLGIVNNIYSFGNVFVDYDYSFQRYIVMKITFIKRDRCCEALEEDRKEDERKRENEVNVIVLSSFFLHRGLWMMEQSY